MSKYLGISESVDDYDFLFGFFVCSLVLNSNVDFFFLIK